MTLYNLRGHTSTVKSVSWDPKHQDLLVTGARDGAICMWDLRVGENAKDGDKTVRSPIMTIRGAHEEKCNGRKSKVAPVARSITGLLYPESDPYGFISSGSYDGYAFKSCNCQLE